VVQFGRLADALQKAWSGPRQDLSDRCVRTHLALLERGLVSDLASLMAGIGEVGATRSGSLAFDEALSRYEALRREGIDHPEAIQALAREGDGSMPDRDASSGEPERDPLVSELQRLLENRGYDPGPVDGVLGEATRRAIRNYQRVLGRESTGEPSPDLLAELQKPCVAAMVNFVIQPRGGCWKPRRVAGGLYELCLRESGDCSEPRKQGEWAGVTDSMLWRPDEPLE